MLHKVAVLVFIIVALVLTQLRVSEAAGHLDLSMRSVNLMPTSALPVTFGAQHRIHSASSASMNGHIWLTAGLIAPVAFWHQIVVHEGSHALAAVILNKRVTGFYPYPHRHEDHFYIGRITYGGNRLSGVRQIAFSLAPAMSDIATFAVSDALLSHRLEADTPGGAVFLVMGMIAPMVDFVVNFAGGGDWQKAREAAGQRAWMLNAVGAVASAVMIYRVIHHARKLF